MKYSWNIAKQLHNILKRSASNDIHYWCYDCWILWTKLVLCVVMSVHAAAVTWLQLGQSLAPDHFWNVLAIATVLLVITAELLVISELIDNLSVARHVKYLLLQLTQLPIITQNVNPWWKMHQNIIHSLKCFNSHKTLAAAIVTAITVIGAAPVEVLTNQVAAPAYWSFCRAKVCWQCA